MKKIITIILVMVLLANNVYAMDMGIMPISVVEDEEISLEINGENILFSSYSVMPYEKNGVMMLPLRSVAENLGFDVYWNQKEKNINIKKGVIDTNLTIGKDEYYSKNSDLVTLEIAPEINNSRTFVPYTFFSQILAVDCYLDGNNIIVSGEYDYELEMTDIAIKSIVADVPSNYMEDNFYGYAFDIVKSPVENNDYAIKLTGNNHSDDMFMGIYRKLSGLEANKEYIFKLNFDLGTNISGGMMGIGGSPGSSVYVKAGFVNDEPSVVLDSLNHIRLENVDKANQSQSGSDLKVVGNMEKESSDYSDEYEYKTLTNYFVSTTNEHGEIYVMIGTDSGFEGITEVYYDNVKISLREASEYNFSTIQESDYTLEYKYVELNSGLTVSVPEVNGFIDTKKQIQLSKIINDKTEKLTAIDDLMSLRFAYTKKDNGLLSITFNGKYAVEGGDFSFYDVLNINTDDMSLIDTNDFIKQDEQSINKLNILFSEKLEKKKLNADTTINSSMKVFYEDGIYAIVFLDKDSDTRETMIIFNENDVKECFNY